MDAILNQATAGLEKDIKPQREPTPEKVEEEAEEESEEEAEEESEEEDEESSEISEFVIPKERTMWQKFTHIQNHHQYQIRTSMTFVESMVIES